MNCSDNIKEIRRKLGLTQRQMSLKLGLSLHMVCLYETNKKKPSIKTCHEIIKLASAYGHFVTLEFLRPE